LTQRALPLFQQEARRIRAAAGPAGMRADFYNHIALDLRLEAEKAPLRQAALRFAMRMAAAPTVMTCARLLLETYSGLAAVLLGEKEKTDPGQYGTMPIPFGRRLRPDLFASAHAHYEKAARQIQAVLASHGLQVYRAPIRNRLVRRNGSLAMEDLKAIVLDAPSQAPAEPQAAKASDIAWHLPDPHDLGLEAYFGDAPGAVGSGDAGDLPLFRYREWDDHLGDYLTEHVWLREHRAQAAGTDFYREVLTRRAGLVQGIRRSFELLKPEGLGLLRQWEEGESFDYRALLDFAIDRKARRTPSPRIYIKRLKKIRDVAVLLLVDMSRSTANRVEGSSASVLEVEKEAIVIFCEALQTVGDKFAVAGFSGSGRLAVDYYRIKDFEESLEGNVAGRIAAMAPQRATRMGGALRHATLRLLEIPARVRLLVLIGDGFPNDVDYKRRYAMEDTRKALSEARARGIYTHAITVNLAADARLDELYGSVHHNVIGDVRELPEKLWRIYGALTRL
jgi:hypothetical protein